MLRPKIIHVFLVTRPYLDSDPTVVFVVPGGGRGGGGLGCGFVPFISRRKDVVSLLKQTRSHHNVTQNPFICLALLILRGQISISRHVAVR